MILKTDKVNATKKQRLLLNHSMNRNKKGCKVKDMRASKEDIDEKRCRPHYQNAYRMGVPKTHPKGKYVATADYSRFKLFHEHLPQSKSRDFL